jgi:hypothetical protein
LNGNEWIAHGRIIKKIVRDVAAPPKRPSQEEAEAAVRTLAWAGDDPAREGRSKPRVGGQGLP